MSRLVSPDDVIPHPKRSLVPDSFRDANRWAGLYGRDTSMMAVMEDRSPAVILSVGPARRDDGVREPGVFVPSITEAGIQTYAERALGASLVTGWFLSQGVDPRGLDWVECPDTPQEGHEVAGRRVYFILAVGQSLVKIGSAASPTSRFRTIQNMSPCTLRLMGSVPGGYERESELHERFAPARQHGEWFALTDDLREFIAGVTDTEAA